MISDVIRYVIFGFLLAAPIGPVMILVIRKGLESGFLTSVVTSLGVLSADATYLLGIYLGLSAFLSIPQVKVVLWIGGTIFFLYLGVSGVLGYKNKIKLNLSKTSGSRTFIAGYVATITNPMTVLVWTSAIGIITISVNSPWVIVQHILSILFGVFILLLLVCYLTYLSKKFIDANILEYVSLIASAVLIGFSFWFGYNAIMNIIHIK